LGKGTEKGYKKEGYDEIFGMNLIKFGKTVTFTQRVKVKSGASSINGYLTYMTCNDEQCLPPTDVDFEISL
ncbi:MAG: disulfide bond formation protein DsbD, partial [Bacteroidota bacterium]